MVMNFAYIIKNIFLSINHIIRIKKMKCNLKLKKEHIKLEAKKLNFQTSLYKFFFLNFTS